MDGTSDAADGGSQPPRWRFLTADQATLAFVLLLAALVSWRYTAVLEWEHVVVTCGLVALVVFALARLHARRDTALVAFLHHWSLAPIVYLLYLELHRVVGPIHEGRVVDDWLQRADLWMFGIEPTRWLGQLQHRWLTEVLQVAYTLFYPLILLVGAELWRRDRRHFPRYAFACALGFYLSFAGYLLAPAVGPRFSIYDFATAQQDLPGLWLTPYLRRFVDAGGLVPTGMPAAVATGLAPRDAFPSGHTLVTILLVVWAWRERLAVRWFVAPAGGLLLLATVYLRYHYVADVLAGGVLAAVVIAAGPALDARLERRLVSARIGVPGGRAHLRRRSGPERSS